MLIDYNMTRDYCASWTAIDAIREMVQNAIDSNKQYVCELDHDNGSLYVVTKDVALEPSMFAMGFSKKSGDSVGGYGEGFKLGMMILARLGLNPSISTGAWYVTGAFMLNEFTQQETFCLHFDGQEHGADTIFRCDITDIDDDELMKKVTHFSEHPLPKVSDVGILYTKPGLIYVNGLYVCEEEKLTHGYNFSPSCIELNRDRNMVTGVEHQLGRYYSESGEASHVFTLIENEARDIAYLQYYLHRNAELKAELARLFHNKYGEGATIGKPGTSYYGGSSHHVGYGTTAYSTMRACGISSGAEVVDPESPLGLLTAFVDDNKKYMHSKAVQNSKTLLNQAKAWRNK